METETKKELSLPRDERGRFLKGYVYNLHPNKKCWWREQNKPHPMKDAETKKKNRGLFTSERMKGNQIINNLSEEKKKMRIEKWRVTNKKNGGHIGRRNPMFGKNHSEKTKKLLSEIKEREYKEGKIVPPNLGKSLSEISKLKISLKNKGRMRSLEAKRQMSIASQRRWNDPEYKKKMIEKKKEIWKDLNFKNKMIEKFCRASWKRPTSLEQKFIDICKKYSLPFDYVGDGKVIINFVNPDFINNNGQKLIIETANAYHHKKGVYEIERSKRFAKYGFRTLILWWDDFYISDKSKTWRKDCDQYIVQKVIEFMGGN